MTDHDQDSSAPVPTKKNMERHVLKKVPKQGTPAQEWGERAQTSKAIATGGQPNRVPPRELDGGSTMTTAENIYLEMEPGAIARVFCSYCKEEIGRVQTVPDGETGDDADVRRKEVQGELTLIADEHQSLCSATSG